MMKIIAPLSIMLLPFAATVPSNAKDLTATEVVAVTRLADACAEAANDPSNSTVFKPGSELQIGPGYTIKVYQTKAETKDPKPVKAIVGMIGRGPDTDVEIPRITAICLDGDSKPVVNKGDIEFSADPGVKKIPIDFRLLDSLKYTHWKNEDQSESNDSVWMIEGTAGNLAHPNKTDWPKCMRPKHVKFNKNKKNIVFLTCENPGSVLTYFYALHMDLIGADKVSVDVAIDPQIIHHPN